VSDDLRPKEPELAAYKTVKRASETEFVINRSRFIGRCYPLESEEQTVTILANVRKRHYDASHNCYAYVLGQNCGTARYSDDGEPGGTAGLPIMEVLKQKGITNALCVVTRYFGGILLGAGGLVRAYSRSASDAAEAAGIAEVRPGVELSFSVDYDLFSRLETYIRKQTQVLACDFAEKVLMRVMLPLEKEEGFKREMSDRSLGRIKLLRLRERYMIESE
jgi:uncharacterized YigZ family protein